MRMKKDCCDNSRVLNYSKSSSYWTIAALLLIALVFYFSGTVDKRNSVEMARVANSGKFEFKSEEFRGGKKFFAFRRDTQNPVTHETALKLLKEGDPDFREAFLDALRHGVDFEAYFFETPGMNSQIATVKQFEFILNNAPSLARVAPDEYSFEEHFKKDKTVVTFPNLGGDAMLVVPCPRPKVTPVKTFAHLASFVRNAETEQISDFLKAVGSASIGSLSSSMSWVSTNGMGVYWLHVRIDTYPKYYTYPPYKQRPAL